MSSTPNCTRCGRPLPDSMAGALCPACLAQLGNAAWANAPDSRGGDGPSPSTQSIAAPGGDEPSPPLQTGPPTPSFGDYELLEEVGRGGMGVVFRARQKSLRRHVALKLILQSRRSSEDMVWRFALEAEAAAQLDHPNIVPVHEVGQHEGQHFYSMKLVQGRDLNDIFPLVRQEKEGWNLPRALGVMVKACQALAYAHSKGVIHRDLKPANIMVGRLGEVYVMDWGLAKIVGQQDWHDIRPNVSPATPATVDARGLESVAEGVDSPLVTMDGSVVGTPAYMPPEQARGQVQEVDQGSDIYSLGAILYHLLTGQPPYVETGVRQSARAILARVLNGPPKRVHQLHAQAPSELIAICEKAMAREKRERYGSSQDMAEDLQAFLDHRVVRAYRTGAVAEFKSWFARNKAAALAGAVSLAVLLLASTFYALRERAKALALQENLARQYLRQGQSLCEQGEMVHGLHWLARSLKEAPEQSVALKEVVRRNLAGWAQRWNAPRAVLTHGGVVADAVLSPDGKRAVTCGYGGRVLFWSAETGEPLPLLIQHPATIAHARFAPDGRRVVTFGDDHTARLWDSETCRPMGAAMRHDDRILSAVFSPDGTRIVTTSDDRTARVWNSETGEALGAPLRHDSPVRAVAFSPDGRRLVTGTAEGIAQLWGTETGIPVTVPMRHSSRITDLAFSPNGRRILTASTDGNARLWSAPSGEIIGAMMRHSSAVRSVDFSPDGRRAVTGSEDGIARVWDTETGEATGLLLLAQGQVGDVQFSADGHSIFVASRDIRIFDSKTGELLQPPLQNRNGFLGVHAHQNTLLANTGGRVAVLWSVEATTSRSKIFKGEHPAATAAFSPDGHRVLVADRWGNTWWWHVETGQTVASRIRHEQMLWALAISPDGKRAITGSEDNTARIWSLDNGERLITNLVHAMDVRAVAFSPDATLTATACFDKTARLWSAEDGHPVGPPLHHSGMVEDIVFSSDGKLVATACEDQNARLWSVRTGHQIGPPMPHLDSVLGVAFSPDGELLATGSRDGTAKLWRVPTGLPTGLVCAHKGVVEDVCFSPDGQSLATACNDRGVRLWSVATGELLGPVLENRNGACEVTFSPDGTRIAAGGFAEARLITLSPPFRGDLHHAELWVQVLTWQEMDANGVLSWLDRATWLARRAQLEKLGRPKLP